MKSCLNRTIYVAIALTAQSPAGHSSAADLQQRPMDQMQGDCSNFAWDLADEFRLWATGATRVVASVTGAGGPALESAKKYDVVLSAQNEVKFAMPPEQDRGGAGKHAGVVAFSPSEDALYRISASNASWIDVTTPNSIVASRAFEMQTKCQSIFKSVAYELKKGTPLILQINGSSTQSIGAL